MSSLKERLTGAYDALFGYDAIDSSTKRTQRPRSTASEDKVLGERDRSQMISTVRDLQRNMTLAGWAIRRHLDYISTFTFQSRTGDRALDNEREAMMRHWSLPENFDATGLMSRQQFIRTLESCRTLDGDVLVIKELNGSVRPIESDRICNPPKVDPSWTNGVRRDASERIDRYGIYRRTTNGLEFDREVPASNCFPLFAYRQRFDQVRGVSPLAPAINTYLDLHDSLTWALSKIKLAQLFGMIITRANGATALGSLTANADTDEYTVDFKKGPVLLDMKPGDDAKFLESHSPSAEAQSFVNTMIPMCLKALDIPYSFYDESYTNYSGARQSLLQYENSARIKRIDVVDFLNRWTHWRIQLAILAGEIKPGMPMAYEWVPTGLPWIDPLKEASANAVEIGSGTNSRTRICKERGKEWPDILEELKTENEQLIKAGMVPTLPTMQIVVSPTEPEPTAGSKK